MKQTKKQLQFGIFFSLSSAESLNSSCLCCVTCTLHLFNQRINVDLMRWDKMKCGKKNHLMQITLKPENDLLIQLSKIFFNTSMKKSAKAYWTVIVKNIYTGLMLFVLAISWLYLSQYYHKITSQHLDILWYIYNDIYILSILMQCTQEIFTLFISKLSNGNTLFLEF